MSKTLKWVLIAIAALGAIALILFAVAYDNGYSGLHKHTEPSAGQIKVACVGDSITYGHGVSGWEKNNYPAQLAEILGAAFHVANFGHSGRTLLSTGDQPYVESEQYRLSLEYKPDIVVFMLGSNDSKPENWTNAEDFRAQLEVMLESYREVNPDVKIYLCTPAEAYCMDGGESGKTSFDIRPGIVDEIDMIIKGYALLNMKKIENLIDVHVLTEEHPEFFEADGVHPDAAGASAIARLVADKIIAGLD